MTWVKQWQTTLFMGMAYTTYQNGDDWGMVYLLLCPHDTSFMSPQRLGAASCLVTPKAAQSSSKHQLSGSEKAHPAKGFLHQNGAKQQEGLTIKGSSIGTRMNSQQ